MATDSTHEELGRQLVEQAYEDLFEEIGRRALHAGGPASSAADEAFRQIDERIARNDVLPRIDEELIAEHEDNPIGQHSDDLQRVLTYFRRRGLEGKYVIVETERNETWCLGRLSGERGVGPEVLRDEEFDSPEAAEHAIFRRRVETLRERFEQAD